MDEDAFNMSLRKFLKTVGVTSQRDIERAVRAALADGRLSGGETLAVEARLAIAGIGHETVVAGEIALQ
jgi:hypothetical protein